MKITIENVGQLSEGQEIYIVDGSESLKVSKEKFFALAVNYGDIGPRLFFNDLAYRLGAEMRSYGKALLPKQHSGFTTLDEALECVRSEIDKEENGRILNVTFEKLATKEEE